MNVAGYDHDEPMIYGKLAIEAHDAKIRAEAAERAVEWYAVTWKMPRIGPNADELRAAILGVDTSLPLPPDVLMDARQETMHVDTGSRRSVKAIRVEALKDASERAVEYIHNNLAKDLGYDDDDLDAAILAGEVEE